MSKTLANLTIDDFEKLIGEEFAIGSYKTVLQSVKEGSETPERFRTPFSLQFKAPEECEIGSEVLEVSHPAIDTVSLLVTQIMGWDEPTQLEICLG